MFTLNCKGKLLVAEKPLVMGIINITHDSFYSGSRFTQQDEILRQAEKMFTEGAAIVDIGGQSTRPGSVETGAEKELQTVVPVIRSIAAHFPGAVISVDTYHASVAQAAVDAGASIVNDISAGNMDSAMLETVGALNTPFVCMHMKGRPLTMQQEAVYEDVTKEVLDFFITKTAACRLAGIHDVIIDPGMGFAKTSSHNLTLLKNLGVFNMPGCPILLGISRKSTIYRSLGVTPAEALNGSTVLQTLGLQNGAGILRVHDVKEAVEAVKLYTDYAKAGIR